MDKIENFPNPIMERWCAKVRELFQALDNKDAKRAEELQKECDAIYAEYKEYADNLDSMTCFPLVCEAVQQDLPILIKKNTKAVHDILTLMKEDKNLSAQFAFINALNNCSTDNVQTYVNEALEMVKKHIDYKTVNESNEKLKQLVCKYGICLNEKPTDEKRTIMENCEYVLTNKKKQSNLNEFTDKMNSIYGYVSTHKNKQDKSKENVFSVFENFEKKYSTLLNEDEKSFVQEIMDFKSNANIEKKKQIFDQLKETCLKGIDELLENAEDKEHNDLIAIKEEINSTLFSNETIVQDIAKLLELRDILLDK